MSDKGIFYGVSIGPGDPELMTIKAVKCIEACDVIATPQTHTGEMLALSITEQTVDVKDKTIVPLYFEMARDPEKMHAAHVKDADAVEKYLAEGKDVAMLNLGDATVYGTYCYIMDIIKERGYAIYPGKVTEAETFRIGNIGEIYKEDIEKLIDIFKEFLSSR